MFWEAQTAHVNSLSAGWSEGWQVSWQETKEIEENSCTKKMAFSQTNKGIPHNRLNSYMDNNVAYSF